MRSSGPWPGTEINTASGDEARLAQCHCIARLLGLGSCYMRTLTCGNDFCFCLGVNVVTFVTNHLDTAETATSGFESLPDVADQQSVCAFDVPCSPATSLERLDTLL